LEEVVGVGAGFFDFGFEFPTGGHEGFNPFHDDGLLGDGWEGDGQWQDVLVVYLRQHIFVTKFGKVYL
jgi:hypothetical protein